MAITLIQSAQTLSPAYNPVVFVLDSTNKNNNGFRYIFDIYNDDTNDLLASIKVAAEPMSGYGYCDISRILNSNLSWDLNVIQSGSSSTDAINSQIHYRVETSEQYLYSWDFTGVTWTPGDGYFTLNGTTVPIWNINNSIEIDVLTGNTWAEGMHIVLANSGNNLLVLDEYGGDTGTTAGTVYWANRSVTTNTGATLSDLYVFNGVLSFGDFINYDYNDYSIPQSPTGDTKQMLTDLPDNFYMTPEQDMFINLFKGIDSTVNVNVKFQNSNGDLLLLNSAYASSYDSRIGQFAAGPGNANPTVASSGTLPLIKSDTEWYDFWLYTAASAQLTKKYRVYIDRRCKIEDYEILFLDRMGSFVSYAFQLRSRETGTIERKNYNKFLGTIDSTGWSYQTTDAGQTNYNINLQKELELNTNWMTDKMSVYFEQLFSSPVTLLKDVDGNYYPVIVQDNGFETIRQKNKNLIKKSIKVRYSNQQNINI